MLSGVYGNQKPWRPLLLFHPRLQLGVHWGWVLRGLVLVYLKLGGVTWREKKKCDFCLSGVLASCGPTPALEYEAPGL